MSLILDQPDNSSNSGGAGIPVADLDARLTNLMIDDLRERWTLDERIAWFNDAAKEIVLRRPAARCVTKTFALASGTYQNAPEGCAQVLDIVRNIKPTGAAGRAIRIADRQAIDDADPNWHAGAARETRNYMVDERSPTSFYVYPPAVSGALVEGLFSEPPPAASSIDDTIDMRAEFINAIINWALYRCHTKDAEYANGSVATLHYQAFTDAIGAPTQAAQTNAATGNSL